MSEKIKCPTCECLFDPETGEINAPEDTDAFDIEKVKVENKNLTNENIRLKGELDLLNKNIETEKGIANEEKRGLFDWL
ncbi:hypothetical protein ES702_04951 [subsurface metagenome]